MGGDNRVENMIEKLIEEYSENYKKDLNNTVLNMLEHFGYTEEEDVSEWLHERNWKILWDTTEKENKKLYIFVLVDEFEKAISAFSVERDDLNLSYGFSDIIIYDDCE